MKKYWKITLVSLAIIIALLFANGCYYVFWGQEQSMKKLQQGKELNLYECCSIYSMHCAVWMFGWTISPEAAQQAFFMHFKGDRYVNNDFFYNIKDNLRYQLALPKGSYKIEKMPDPDREYYTCVIDIHYTNNILNIKGIPFYSPLFKELEKKGWLHTYTMYYF